MKDLYAIFATLLVLAVGGCSSQLDMEAERAAIRKFHDDCMTAVQVGNVDCFAEDFQLLPHDAPPMKGKKAMGELVSHTIEDPNFSFSHDIVRIEVSRSNDLAYIHYTYEFVVSDKDGNPVAEQGKAIYLLKKQPQVGWIFLIDIWNTDGARASHAMLGTYPVR